MAAANVVKNDVEETSPQTTQTAGENKIVGKEFLYTVQAGAFTNSDNAKVLQKEIENAGMISFIQDKNVAGTVFKVVFIGKFETRKEAEDFLPIANTRFRITGRVAEINQ